ncbi:peroxisomal membrane protein 11B [Coturnix japonica]|uniref:peroxisomal membrane protein 11B n=1 Tax=Coturnix japonica TaxID=93934 RepID=UPI0013A5E4BD|nr:peroxisomal membrane protein 11B [Coturnix japonica]
METWVRFSAQSHGRERLLRVAQFACVLVGDALRRNGGSAAILDHVTRLEAHLGLGRKLLPLLFHPGSAPSCPGSSRYFLFSILLNLSRDAYEIRQLMEREATGRRSSKGTGTGTGTGTRTGPGCVSEQRSHAGLQRLQELRLRLQVELRLLLRVLRGNPPLLLDLLKNLCDLCIPLERLRLRRCGAAVLGLCGVTASLLSIVTILQPWLRLKP